MELIARDRRHTDCLKWDKEPGPLQMWVADMEFETLPAVTQALVDRAKQGIFGYGIEPEGYRAAVCSWMQRRHDWTISEDSIVPAPSNVAALKLLIQTLTQPGDRILVQKPVYYMFDQAALSNGRQIVSSDLVCKDGRYSIDLADFERVMTEQHVKLFILCNPHNPVGRVYTKQELKAIGEICRRRDVFVISDEVHADFILEGKHVPFPMASPECEMQCAVLTGPNKTFNLAGLKCANVILANPEIRERFRNQLDACGVLSQNIFSLLACKVAYQQGGEYVEALCRKLRENDRLLRQHAAQILPQVQAIRLEGTYLLWLDVSTLGLHGEALHRFLLEKAELHVDEGEMFGSAGEGFIRLNLACDAQQVTDAIDRIARAAKEEKLI